MTEEIPIFPLFPLLNPRFEVPLEPGAFLNSKIPGIVAGTPLPRSWKREWDLSESEWEKIVRCWSEFRGPVKSADHFLVPIPLDSQGNVTGMIEYEKGRLEFRLYEGEEQDEIPWDRIPHPEPVTVLKAEKRIGPNDRCSCGSGKKFKKCCMFGS